MCCDSSMERIRLQRQVLYCLSYLLSEMYTRNRIKSLFVECSANGLQLAEIAEQSSDFK